jgi:hypothetical protein
MSSGREFREVSVVFLPEDVLAMSSNALRFFQWNLGTFFACL